MPVRLHHIVVDAHDLPVLARFWTEALGWKVLSEREHEIVIGTDDRAPVGMCFMPVTDPKTIKNRMHLDVTTGAEDRDQEIERLLALGAQRVNIGQTGAESWTVLADPEGNEFCVIRRRKHSPGKPGAVFATVQVMTIVPDSKDWTWVLQRPCPECGLDTQSFPRDAIAGMIRSNAAAWQDALTQSGDARRRPAPGTWSALEYGCHVRDVLRLYDQRLLLMLTQEGPLYPNWDQDSTAIADRYSEQDPAVVAAELADAAETIAARFESMDASQWQRTGSRSDGAQFTVESFARYFIHDPVHHLHDVTGAP